MTPSVSVRGLSKAFARIKASRVKGVSSEGAAALRHLVRRTMRGSGRAVVPADDDPDYLWALKDVGFDVAPGEVLGIIGRNGAGKSTLLKILARVLHPTSGHVEIRGRVVSMLELGVGLAPELSVRQNIQIQGRLAGVPSRRIDEAEDWILEFAGLTEFRDTPLELCPTGSAVHLGFSSMIGLGADIILADEVLAVGDAAFRQASEERVRAAGAAGESVLFVSHDMNAVRRICTRVIWIDKGRIFRVGPTADVVDAYAEELLSGRLLPPLTARGLAQSCRILDAHLLDANRATVGALQITKAGFLECLVRMNRPDVAAFVDIELWRARHCLFRVTSDAITSRLPATFRVAVGLPADFLNEMSYEARFRLRAVRLSSEKRFETVVGEERFEFSALNTFPDDSVWNDWSWNRNGLVSPRLAWTVPEESPMQAAPVVSPLDTHA